VGLVSGRARPRLPRRRRKFCSRITCASSNLPAARRFADRFKHKYPNAVAYLRNDLDELLTVTRTMALRARKWLIGENS
jgi:hypothetical protein